MRLPLGDRGHFRPRDTPHNFRLGTVATSDHETPLTKRAQQDSGEGRVTAKSRSMMNLTARTPSIVSSSASANPGRTSYGHHEPEQPVLDDRAGRPVETSRSNYSQEYGSSWSSQVWKSGNGEHDRSGKPEQNSWESLERVDPHRGEHRTKKLFTKERGDPIQRIPRERLILKSSSWEVTQQNLFTKSRTKCEFDRKECLTMQKIVPNIR